MTTACKEGIMQFLSAPNSCHCGETKPRDGSLCLWNQEAVECMHGTTSVHQEQWIYSLHRDAPLPFRANYGFWRYYSHFCCCCSSTLKPRGNSLHRSEQSFRKAIFLYTSLVVKGIPQNLFRCEKCVSFDKGLAFYDQLAFDCLAIGYKTTDQNSNSPEPNAEDSNAANSSNHFWQAPVCRVPAAAREAYLIDSKALKNRYFLRH